MLEQKAYSFEEVNSIQVERLINQQILEGWFVKFIAASFFKSGRYGSGVIIYEREIKKEQPVYQIPYGE